MPSEDGSELYVFSGYNAGRHVATLDAVTGQIRYLFQYGTYTVGGRPVELLTAVSDLRGATDGIGRTLTINRDPSTGNLASFVSAGAQSSGVVLNADNLLWKLTRPTVPDEDGSTYEMLYQPGATGLLTNFFDPRDKEHSFQYNTDTGKLEFDRDPLTLSGTAFKTLTRTPLSSGNGYEVAVTTNAQLTTNYAVESLDTGDRSWTMSWPNNTRTVVSTTKPDESSTITYPDSTVVKVTKRPDPIFGTSALVPSTSIELPVSHKHLILNRTRTSDSADLNFNTLTETVLVKKSDTDPDPAHGYETTLFRAPAAPEVPHYLFTTPAGRAFRANIDSYGRITSVGLDQDPPIVQPVSIQYDNYGRVTLISQSGRQMAVGWNSSTGFVNSITAGSTQDPTMFSVQPGIDGRAELRTITRKDNKQIKFLYDASSNLKKLERPNGSGWTAHQFLSTDVDLLDEYNGPDVTTIESNDGRTQYDWDKDRRLQLVTWTDGTVVDLEYNQSGTEAGKLHYLKDRNGAVLTSYGYDAATGHLQMILGYLTGVATTLGWDGAALTSVLTTWPGSMAKSVNWAVGDYLHVDSESVSNGNSVSYTYDDDGLITKASAAPGGVTHDFNTPRNAFTGWIDSTSLTRVSQTWTHDPTYGQMQTITTRHNTLFNNHIHTLWLSAYDGLGRITTKQEKVLAATIWTTTSYTYDSLGRLTGPTGTTWGYDDNGNRTKLNGVTVGTYDVQDRIQSWNGATFTHYATGNRKTKTASGSTTTYNYDLLQNLSRVDLPNNVVITYELDGAGRRVGRRKVVNGGAATVRRYLLGEGNRVVAEHNENGTIVSQFVYATRSHVPDYMIQGSNVYRFVTDQLGSVRLVVNDNASSASASVVKQISYDAWGNITSETGTLDQPFGFAGGLQDRDTGLVHFGAREYDPFTGRWLQKDPIRFAGGDTNLYAYAGNDPVNGIDPTGYEVTGVYDRGNGVLTLVDEDTGAVAVGDFHSGNWIGAPIPLGEWEIINDEQDRPGYYRVDRWDGSRDDIDAATGRNHFRLHGPGGSIGCMTAQTNSDWAAIDDLLSRTRTSPVQGQYGPVAPYSRTGLANWLLSRVPEYRPFNRFGRVRVVN